MSEWIDVVDAHDRVVGRATRAEMRRDNLLHRAVYILVTNSRGELFIHERTTSKDVYPGYRDVTVGGVVAAGEDYDTAAARELAEELGVSEAILERLGPTAYADAGTRVHGMVYRARHDGPFVLQPEEIVSGKFVALGCAERLTREARCCPDGAAVLRVYADRLRAGS
ncbi:MAG TPA: NUDIX domain-containing protein [Candidatus Binatia bacterium]